MLKGYLKFVMIFIILFLVIGCSMQTNNSMAKEDSSDVVKVEYSPKIMDNPYVYEKDRPDELVYLYLTITDDNVTKDPPINWDRLNKVQVNEYDTEQIKEYKSYKINAILQEGDEAGPKPAMFGYSHTYANSVVSFRGQSTLSNRQKAYKIKLIDQSSYWRNQKTINLLKHEGDLTRMLNKLSFDYFQLLPNITSARTQFVHLFVKDLTATPPNTTFIDYGLYTHIEQINKKYLRSHGLDPKGHLYKANSFEFYRYPEQLKLTNDPDYDLAEFETILEVKGSQDHAKLIQMLDDLNNYSLNIDDVFAQYFDADNFYTWLAITIIFNNNDTGSQNFYLYSPLNSSKWFFIPWDYDDAWMLKDKRNYIGLNWKSGLSNYWNNVLMRRLFENPDNIEKINAKIVELMKIVTPEQTKAFVDAYRTIVPHIVSQEPDIAYLPGTIEQFHAEVDSLMYLPELIVQQYFADLENPMPFYMGNPVLQGEKIHFNWDYSYDLQGNDLTYHFQISTDLDFTNIIVDNKDLVLNTITISKLPAGQYYWRVTAIDSLGNAQSAFDTFVYDDYFYLGIQDFYIDP